MYRVFHEIVYRVFHETVYFGWSKCVLEKLTEKSIFLKLCDVFTVRNSVKYDMFFPHYFSTSLCHLEGPKTYGILTDWDMFVSC